MSVTKAEDVLAASGDGTNNTTVLRYTLELASASNAIPQGWYGQFVRMRPVGGDMFYFFSKVTGATVANPAAAADGGPGITRGEYVPAGERMEVQVPYADGGDSIFFVRIGSAAATSVYMAKASGQAMNNNLNGR